MEPGKSHPGKGELRAYHDQALSKVEHCQIETHLKSCAHCQAKLTTLAARSQQVEAKLLLLDTLPDMTPEKSRLAAYNRITNRLRLERRTSI